MMLPRLLTESEKAALIPLVKEWEEAAGIIVRGEEKLNRTHQPLETELYQWAVLSLEISDEEMGK